MTNCDWNLHLSPSHIGLMGHVIADYPSPDAVRAMIKTMVVAGAKVIEIQIPFSEPMADGPLFLAANHRAIAQGVDYKAALQLMGEVSRTYPQVRFLFMSYLNVIFKRGYESFVKDSVSHGASGVIVPDLPVEYAATIETSGASQGFANVRVIAPNTNDQRLDELTSGAAAVARAGVTGAKSDFSSVKDFVARLRQRTSVPIAVGFGVRSAADIHQLRGIADLAVIGSASLQRYEEAGIEGVQALWQELAAAAD
jgi:tryptophan synthase alpha chain